MAIQYRSPHIYRNVFKYRGDTPELSMRARISAPVSHTLTVRSRIAIHPLQTFAILGRISLKSGQTLSMQSRIRAQSVYALTGRAWVGGIQHFTMRARILKRQGWPVVDTMDPGYSIWQDTRLDFRARLTHYIAFPTQTFRMKCRVTYGKTLSLQSQARIVTAGFMSMRAHILPRFFTAHVPMRFDVRRTSQTRLRVVFYMQGDVQNPSMTMKARIVGVYSSRMTGHFIVASPIIFNSVLSIENPVTLARTQQLLSTRARIVK